MNNTHPPLREGQQVIFIDPAGQQHTATITLVLGEHGARIEWGDGQHAAIALFDSRSLPGTFHFPSATASAKAAKKEEAKPKE